MAQRRVAELNGTFISRERAKQVQDKEGKIQGMMSESRTVFLVDDDPFVRRALTRLIKSAGYTVQAFASARDFLAYWRATDEGPACLALDVRMPGLSGLDLQHELQAAHTLLPIIFVTGHGDIPMSVKADGARLKENMEVQSFAELVRMAERVKNRPTAQKSE